MAAENDQEFADPNLLQALEAFARHERDGQLLLPWVARLSTMDQDRLRSDLSVVLEEPALTGEPVDWREIGEILQEAAEAAGVDEPLVRAPSAPPDGDYVVHLRGEHHQALAGASPAVRETTELLLREFLPHYPTAPHLLPRGRLKKLRERDTWQLQLPDGYRLRYLVERPLRAVHIVYLGPHPDRDTRGRERHVRVQVKRRRHGES
jgi:hypothetical protein